MPVRRKTRTRRGVYLSVVVALVLSAVVGIPASSSFAAAAPAAQSNEVDLYASVLAGQEAFCSWAYQDIKNIWTIGYGFDLRQNRAALLEAGIETVRYPSLTRTPGYRVGDQNVNTTRASLTRSQALAVLKEILKLYIARAKSVFGYSTKEWNAENLNRRAAMVSMVYNGWAAGSKNAAQIRKAIANGNWQRASVLSAQRYRALKDQKRATTIPVLLLGNRPAFPPALCSHAFVAKAVASPATVSATDGKPVTVKVTATSDPLVIPNTRVTMTAGTVDPATANAAVGTGGKTFTVAPRGRTGSGSIVVTCLTKGSTTAVVTLTGVPVAGSHVTPTPMRRVKVPVTCDGVTVTTTRLPDARVGEPYSAQLTASGGTEPYTWTGAHLPAGLSLDPYGKISGTPTAKGTAQVQVAVADDDGETAEATLGLTVSPPLPAIPAGTPPAPPAQPACNGKCGTTLGDPHLTTFDGAHYDFQQAGEFVAVASTTDDFQIQVRQRPWNGSRLVAGNTAVAFEVAGHRVGAYLSGTGITTLVDGRPVTLTSSPHPLPGGGSVISSASGETVSWPDGSFATVIILSGFLTVDVSVVPARQGHLVGLLGDDDGNPADDLTTRGGDVLPYPATAAQLYGAYAAGWRVKQAESLFDYDPGQSTGTFTDTAFPYAYADVATLPSANRDAATAVCQAAGVTTQPYLDSCVLDLALTGDLGSVTAAAAGQAFGTSAVLAASSPGDSWSDPSGATGTAALSYGHIGCSAVNAQRLCTNGLWPIVPAAPWIWTSQFTTAGQATATFTKTVTVTADQAAGKVTLTIDGDNLYTATLNGTQVATGSLGAPLTTTVHLVPGANTIAITVTNTGGYNPGGNPAGLSWKLTTD